MNRHYVHTLAGCALILVVPCFSFALDNGQVLIDNQAVITQVEQEEPLIPEPVGEAIEEDTEWKWGDVLFIDIVNSQLVVKYIDYEIDASKEINFNVDPKTVFEGVKDLGEIKIQDSVSVDYVVSDGKNIARLISVDSLKYTADDVTVE